MIELLNKLEFNNMYEKKTKTMKCTKSNIEMNEIASIMINNDSVSKMLNAAFFIK